MRQAPPILRKFANPHVAASTMGLSYQGITILIGLLLTPFLLTSLGPEVFGVWALLGTLNAYEVISDLGIPGAMVMFINTSKRVKERNSIITIGIIANTALTLVMLVVLLLLKDVIIGLVFRTGSVSQATIEQGYYITLASLAFLVLARSFSAVLDAFQRVHVRLAVDIFGSVSFALLAWKAAQSGYGLIGVVAAGLAAAVLRTLLSAGAAFLVYRGLRPNFFDGRHTLKRILGYGLRGQGANIGLSLSDPLLKSLIGAGAGPTSVGAVQMGSSISSIPNSTVYSMIGNLFPSIASANGRQDRQTIDRLVSRYFIFIACLIIPTTVAIILIANDLVTLWLGSSYPDVQLALKITAMAFAFRALSMVPWRVSWGLGRPQDSSIAMLLHLAVLASAGALLVASDNASMPNLLYAYVASYGISALFLFYRMFWSLDGFWAEHGRQLAKSIFQISLITLTMSLILVLFTQSATSLMRLGFAGMSNIIAVAVTFAFSVSAEERSQIIGRLRLVVRRLLPQSN